jgi:lipopolysaccharide biosynthesis glycosyltransferase
MSIYVSYFSDAVRIENDVLVPIQVGRELAKTPLADMIGDDTGDSISKLNPAFCEMTAIYWAWKNAARNDEYIGFFHYRRLLDFNTDEKRKITQHGVIVEPRYYDGLLDEYGLTPERIRQTIEGYDLVLPQAFDVRNVGEDTVQFQYSNAAKHHARDFTLLGDIIKRLSPGDYGYFRRVARGHYFYPTNVFVARQSIFEVYCAWIFPILFELHKSIDISQYDAAERRAVGYLAERLFSVFVAKYLAERPRTKVLELRRLYIADTTARAPAIAAPEDRATIPIVACTDSNYVPQMSALLASICENTDAGRPIQFVILQTGLTRHESESLQRAVSQRKNLTLNFIDMADAFSEVTMSSFFTRTTLFRLRLADLLPNHQKVLFLDTDMIALRDLAPLYDSDVEGYLVAAVPDLIMRSFMSLGIRTDYKTGHKTAHQYVSDNLKLGDRTRDYFQAGTIVINLSEMRKAHQSPAMIADIKTSPYWFFDQDILNKHCRGRVKFLDHRWNVTYMDEAHLAALTNSDREKHRRSNEDAAVIHYAGAYKPWQTRGHPLEQHFWYYLRKTEHFETVFLPLVAQMSPASASPPPARRGIAFRFARAIWRSLPPFLRSRLARHAHVARDRVFAARTS